MGDVPTINPPCLKRKSFSKTVGFPHFPQLFHHFPRVLQDFFKMSKVFQQKTWVSHGFSDHFPCFCHVLPTSPGMSRDFPTAVLRELLAAQQPKGAGRRGAAQELGDAPEPAPVDLLGPRWFWRNNPMIIPLTIQWQYMAIYGNINYPVAIYGNIWWYRVWCIYIYYHHGNIWQ